MVSAGLGKVASSDFLQGFPKLRIFFLTVSLNIEFWRQEAESPPQTNHPHIPRTDTMHLMYTLDSEGNRLYTLKKVVSGEVTKSAHPARFSPDDKYSRCARDL